MMTTIEPLFTGSVVKEFKENVPRSIDETSERVIRFEQQLANENGRFAKSFARSLTGKEDENYF